MAKKSVVMRQKKREVLVLQYAERRKFLKSEMKRVGEDSSHKMKAMLDFQKLPRDSSPSRLRNRCQKTGRPRGYFRRFGLCSWQLRSMAMNGELPGIHKASW